MPRSGPQIELDSDEEADLDAAWDQIRAQGGFSVKEETEADTPPEKDSGNA